MRLREITWATAALAAAGIGYFAGTSSDSCRVDEQYTAIPLSSEEECDGPRLTHIEPIDLSCIETVHPYDLFVHTSEPPLAGPVTPQEVRQVGFEFPDIALPSLPDIPSSEGNSPGRLPADIEKQGTELPDPHKRLDELVNQSEDLRQAGQIWRRIWTAADPGQVAQVSARVEGGPTSGGGCVEGCCPCSKCPCCAKTTAESPAMPLPPAWFVGPPAPDGWIGPE